MVHLDLSALNRFIGIYIYIYIYRFIYLLIYLYVYIYIYIYLFIFIFIYITPVIILRTHSKTTHKVSMISREGADFFSATAVRACQSFRGSQGLFGAFACLFLAISGLQKVGSAGCRV